MPSLDVSLDAPLPERIGVGGGTAVFVAGWCVSDAGRPSSLRIVVDGAEQPVTAHGMPRIDVLRALHPEIDPYDPPPGAAGYRSGFWGMAKIGSGGRGSVELGVRAVFPDGSTAEARLGSIAIREPEPPIVPPPVPGRPLVAIAMATYEPRAELLRVQLDSIRAQTHADWVCLISDDCSSREAFTGLTEAVAGDPRFVISRSDRRLGFYRNFERALELVPAGADFVAMADQDDAWHPDKLATLLGAIGSSPLVYSDARVVGPSGDVRAETYWGTRRNVHDDLRSLLVANAVTGAASLLRRDLLDTALPFPPGQFSHFHDHWLGLVAQSLGEIAYVDRPLYDYVQHGDAVLGHEAANRVRAWRARIGGLRRDPRERVRMWRMHYFVDIARLAQFATVLLMRAGPRMSRPKRRALEGFLKAESSLPELLRLWGRGARELVRRRPETLGAEWMLAYALTWRRLLAVTARDRPVRGLRLDAMPPHNLAPVPGRLRPEGEAGVMAEKVMPLPLAVRDDAPARVNLLIPTIDLAHLFGGYIAKYNLARRLAERGARVRIVTVDPVPPLPPDWREQIERFEGLAGLFGKVEVAFGREAAGGLEVSREDRFVATTFWTAHVAADAVRALGAERFLYLIQEYEPLTVPDGGWTELAERSYAFPHTALFSTELLRSFFRESGIGVYAGGAAAGDRDSLAFQNAITTVPAPDAAALAARETRRLLFYARPEAHAARNLFDLGMAALRRAVAQGTLDGWELRGIGTTAPGGRLDLGGGVRLELLPRAGQGEYAARLAEHDVGLALMDTPHPSLVPIEMASAGMLAVTSAHGGKTPEAMAAISPNLITAAPSVDAIAGALAEAVAASGDAQRRVAGSDVAWARSWEQAFSDELLDRVDALLRRP